MAKEAYVEKLQSEEEDSGSDAGKISLKAAKVVCGGPGTAN